MSEDAAGMEGIAPSIVHGTSNPEARKYRALWERPEYRRVAPGEDLAGLFLSIAKPKPGARVVDFGCGTGRGALQLATLGQCDVTMVDFANNCLDDDVRQMLTTQADRLRFEKADLETGPLPVGVYGYCTDVMEHIPTDKIQRVLVNILTAAQHVFFSISTVPDSCGALIGEELHLTIKPYSWWLQTLTALQAVVHWSQDTPGAALFYVTAWMTGEEITAGGVLNVEDAEILANVKANTGPQASGKRWRQLGPHNPTEEEYRTRKTEVAILGGGPSLPNFLSEMRELKRDGIPIVTLNGAYGWALEHGLGPVTEIMVDAREFNKRFVQPIREDCMYLLSSQVHPAVFEGLPWSRTFLWHSGGQAVQDAVKAAYGEEHPSWFIGGGSSVLMRAIPLLHFLGYHRFHLFGCDSCLMEPNGSGATTWQHHAYPQPENDRAALLPTTLGGRMFVCHPWMVSQANEMYQLLKVMGDMIEVEVYGQGLLAWILEYGAGLAEARAEIMAPAPALPS